jgi:hypothetical protein
MSRRSRSRKRARRWDANFELTYRWLWRLCATTDRKIKSERPHMVRTRCSWEHVNDLMEKSLIHNGRKP